MGSIRTGCVSGWRRCLAAGASRGARDRWFASRGHPLRRGAVAGGLSLLLLAPRAPADLDVELIRGGRVEGRIDPADEIETFHVDLPAGAVLKVAASPVAKSDRPVTLSLYDPFGDLVAEGEPAGKGVRIPKLTVTDSGRHDLEIGGDGAAPTGYGLALTWKSPKGARFNSELDFAGDAYAFVADAGARATFEVRAAKGSAARPRIVDATHDESGYVVGLPAPAPGAKRHKVKSVALPETGDWTLNVVNDGDSGRVAVSIAVKQPSAAKAVIVVPTLPEPTPGVEDIERGLVGESGGTVNGSGAAAGALIEIPSKATEATIAIEVGAAEDLEPSDENLAAAGPAVFFGPPGTQFDRDVTITLPFDPAEFPDGFEGLEVLRTESDEAEPEVVPRETVEVNPSAGTASFPVRHFTKFQVFNRPKVTRVTSSDGEPGDEFGITVDVDGDTFVSGAPRADGAASRSGAAYVFARSGDAWTPQQKLTDADGSSDDVFGTAVAIDGNTVAVGAPFDDDDGDNSGSVHVFVRSGTTWSRQQVLAAPGASAGDLFGEAVDLRGDRLVVGAPGTSDVASGAGAAHVFVRVGTSWSLEDSLYGSDVAAGDRFGERVALSGDLVAVGAQRRDTPQGVRGKVYVFARSGSAWSEERIVGPPAGDSAAQAFASFLALDGTTLAVGAYADSQTGADAGAVFVFTRGTGTWPLQQKLRPPLGSSGILMGSEVAVSGDTVVAAAPYGGANATGALLVFTRTGTVWTAGRTIAPPNAGADDLLGLSVAVRNRRVVAGYGGIDDFGTNAGFVYVYDNVGK